VAARLTRDPHRAPLLALSGVVAIAAVVYAALARSVEGPHVFGDELYYSEAGTSLAEGDGLRVRGEDYDFGPLYPVVLAAIRLAVSDQPSAHWPWLAANGVFVALAAIPSYLLARRLLDPWWSVAVAAFAVAAPSAFYAGAVMTDCLGYLAAVSALLAITLAVERSSVARQAGALVAIGVATAVRPQFASLFVTLLLALALRWALADERRARLRAAWPRLWPTVAVAAAGLAAVVAMAAAGRPPGELLGGYDDLARGYPVVATARWAVEHVFDLALYLGLVGVAAAPLALVALWSRGRAGSVHDQALLAVFVAANVTGIVVVAAFSASQFGLGRLHDRYLFYVVPLWLVLLATWIARGAPRSRMLAAACGVAFVAFVLVMPYGTLVVPDGAKMFDGTGTAIWATLQDWLATTHGVSGRWALAAGSVATALWLVAVPARHAWTLAVVVAASFVAANAIMWDRTIADSRKGVFADRAAATRGWVDAAVPGTADVTLLTVGTSACLTSVGRHSYLFTEFFNTRIEAVPYLGDPLSVGPPTHPVHVGADGTVLAEGGAPLVAPYLVAPSGVPVVGRRLAEGTEVGLVLWRTAGPVRIAGAAADADVLAEACTA